MFTEWFGIKYPLPKLDLLAIPDFSAGAMVLMIINIIICSFVNQENWGAVTYRETALLVLEGVSSSSVISFTRMRHIIDLIICKSKMLAAQLLMRSPISGSEIWSQWSGGLIFG